MEAIFDNKVVRVEGHSEHNNIFRIDIGNCVLTVWMNDDMKFAKLVNVHNVNSDKGFRASYTGKTKESVWLDI